MIYIIAAISKNNVIGKDGTLPWHIPEDLRRFKELTLHKYVVMGKHTYDSIYAVLGHALPSRKNIVITSHPGNEDGVFFVSSFAEAEKLVGNEEMCVIGGSRVYAEALPKADILHITWVEREVDGDVYFPALDWSLFNITSNEQHEGFRFTTYERIKN